MSYQAQFWQSSERAMGSLLAQSAAGVVSPMSVTSFVPQNTIQPNFPETIKAQLADVGRHACNMDAGINTKGDIFLLCLKYAVLSFMKSHLVQFCNPVFLQRQLCVLKHYTANLPGWVSLRMPVVC